MLLGQFMELQGEVILRLHSPQSSQVFSETLEVSGRSGMVIGLLDKITSESAPTDKALHIKHHVLQELYPFPRMLTAVFAVHDF